MKTMTYKTVLNTLLIALLTFAISGCSDTADDPAPAPVSVNTLIVENDARSVASIYYLYVSESTDTTWGAERLGAGILTAGQTKTMSMSPCGVNYDIKATYSDGTDIFFWDTYLACDSTATRIFYLY